MNIPYTSQPHPETGMTNGKIGMWLFLASELMLFGALFTSYILLRSGAPTWQSGWDLLNVPLATANTAILILSSITMAISWTSLTNDNISQHRVMMMLTILSGSIFLILKGVEYTAKFEHHIAPSTNNFYAIYFTLTGVHALHLVGGILFNLYLLTVSKKLRNTNPKFYAHKVELAGLYWHFVDFIWIIMFASIYLV